MERFLSVVARGYSNHYPDISKLTFILPNKRSGTFLLREFAALSRRPILAPRILTISDFISLSAENVVDSRLDLLFRLYLCYTGLLPSGTEIRFEKFRSWGETVLADFNEIDLQMVDAGEIFKNVYDLNSIKSNFLTQEQKKVMVDYFGYSPDLLVEKLERFWQNVDVKGEAGGSESEVKTRFRSLWQLLKPLYDSFKRNLHESGLTTQGGAYRETAERLESGFEPLPGEKFIFVGFNALSESESRIFRALKQMKVDMGLGPEPKADFIWDKVSPVFAEDDDPALKFVSVNSRRENFPPPEWLRTEIERSVPLEAPEIKIISVPSNVMQVKVAGMELARIAESIPQEEIRNAEVAVVLPDENLLLPLMYSLPEVFSKPNLTMGFPLKQTPVISFASLLRRLHSSCRQTERGNYYFVEDVRNLLGHPYSRILFEPEKIEGIMKYFDRQRRLIVAGNTLLRLGRNAEIVFENITEDTPPLYVIDFIRRIMKLILENIGPSDDMVAARVEKTYIGTYLDVLARLYNCISEYSIAVSPSEVFLLADRLCGTESAVFEGEPLQGLQIMGVLETRCLDFNRIIMLSMNEKIMPRVGRSTSFIPNIIRSAFGMPPANYQEEIFSYYFFRVLGRCREGVLTYDSRSSEIRTPGPSRYLLQMKYLARNLSIREVEGAFGMPTVREGDINIEKTDEIMSYLERYVSRENGKNLSASALNHYFGCKVMFLYNDVLRLGLERELIESIDAIDLGLIVHKAIERLYFPEGMSGKLLEKPIVMTEENLLGLLTERKEGEKETKIENAARRAILEIHFGVGEGESEGEKLKGSPAIILEYIVRYIRNIIEADLLQVPFRLWGSEIEEMIVYPMPSGKKVNFKMVIDRLDQEGEEGADRPFRIVDYKTGTPHVKAEGLNEIFEGDRNASNLFQLIFYAELLIYAFRTGLLRLPEGVGLDEFQNNLILAIYSVVDLPDLKKGIVYPSIGSRMGEKGKEVAKTVQTMGELREVEREEGVRFMDKLHEMVGEILDRDVSFYARPSEDLCKYCDYRLRCEMKRALDAPSGSFEKPTGEGVA